MKLPEVRSLTPRQRYLKQLRKEREIGVDPIYLGAKVFGGRLAREALSEDWKAVSKDWDRANRAVFV